MALDLNRPNITPVKGLYVYMPNVPEPHNCIVSSSQSTPLVPGDILTLDTSSTNTHCPVVKKADKDDVFYGVVPHDALKNSYAAGEKCMAAIEGSYIYMVAGGAIALGADLYTTSAGKVTSTATAGDSILGTANTVAGADGDLIQVKLKFATTSVE